MRTVPSIKGPGSAGGLRQRKDLRYEKAVVFGVACAGRDGTAYPAHLRRGRMAHHAQLKRPAVSPSYRCGRLSRAQCRGERPAVPAADLPRTSRCLPVTPPSSTLAKMSAETGRNRTHHIHRPDCRPAWIRLSDDWYYGQLGDLQYETQCRCVGEFIRGLVWLNAIHDGLA